MMKKGDIMKIKSIEGYVNYYVCENGDIISKKTGKQKVLKPSTSTGYEQVTLSDRIWGKKTHQVHRLVAEAFLPNPDRLPVVHHKDHDKTNNHVSNLEWVDYSRNTKEFVRNHLPVLRANRAAEAMKKRKQIDDVIRVAFETRNPDLFYKVYSAIAA